MTLKWNLPWRRFTADPRDEEIIVLKEEAAALKDRLLRLAAEMENLRKRTEREKAEATLYAAYEFRPRSLERGRQFEPRPAGPARRRARHVPVKLKRT